MPKGMKGIFMVFLYGFIYGPNSMESNTKPFSRKYTVTRYKTYIDHNCRVSL